MSVTKTLYGTTYTIPESREKKWGSSMTALLSALAGGAEGSSGIMGTVPFLRFPSFASSVVDDEVFAPTYPWHRLSGATGPSTLNSIQAISDGSADGQILILSGANAVNTVTVPDGANTHLNGDCTLGLYEVLVLIWSETVVDWIEVFRST